MAEPTGKAPPVDFSKFPSLAGKVKAPAAASPSAPAAASATAAAPAPAAKSAQECAKAATTSTAKFNELYGDWLKKPWDKARWETLTKFADNAGAGSCPVAADALAFLLWSELSKLKAEPRTKLAAHLVRLIGPTAGSFHEEVLLCLIERGTQEIRDEIERVLLNEIPREEIKSGKVDAACYEKCIKAIAAKRENECGEDKSCYNKHAKLFEQYARYRKLISLSAGACYRTFASVAGEPLLQSNPCGFASFDWLTGERPDGTRVSYGGTLTLSADLTGLTLAMVGPRVGWQSRYVGVSAEGGYLRLSAEDATRRDVPIEFDSPAVNEAGTAYRMKPINDSMRILDAGYVMLNVDGSVPFQDGGWLHFFWDVNFGLFAGGVSDDPCSYSYVPASDSVEVNPDGTATAKGRFTDRCRSGEATVGAMLGVNAGVRATF